MASRSPSCTSLVSPCFYDTNKSLAKTHYYISAGAVDMDIYGAFQVCSIGILAAPVTVRLSKTYFNDPGRNIIFLWTAIVFAGLLSLTVEFFRTQSTQCLLDVPISYQAFLNNGTITCGLVCSIQDGPFSPMRRDSSNNIYVIPIPDALTFGTSTLLAAGCCIPAILSLFSTWNKILDLNWQLRFGSDEHPDSEGIDSPIQGTNGATVRDIRQLNVTLRKILSVVEVPVFAAAVLAILVLGERNFWSVQVDWQTEPIQSVGACAFAVSVPFNTRG
jgi:hypothetical protein